MNNQRLDYNQDMIDNFMLFVHNMQLQQNTVLSSQISQLSIFNSLLHNSARERIPASRSSSFPGRRPSRVFLNRNNNSPINPVNFHNLGSFLNSNVEVFPSTEQINNATEILSYSEINNPINSICPIRNENFNENDIVIRINHCGHIFYPNEFYGWFRNHVRCPMCRYDIRDASNNDISNNRTNNRTNNRSSNLINHINTNMNTDVNTNMNTDVNTNMNNHVNTNMNTNTPIIDFSNNINQQYQTQFDICYNIFPTSSEDVIPEPSQEALLINNQDSDSLHIQEINFTHDVSGENSIQNSAIAELTRTMANALVNQLQTNMSNDVSNNQVEMAFSFMTPVISTTTTDFNDISMNEID